MKIKVILNPRSMNGMNPFLEAILRERFGNAIVGIERTVHPHHATAAVNRAIKEGVDTIVAAGGDGTVNGILNALVGADIALGILPTGTANDLATLYQIPSDLHKACQVILKRRLHRADLIRVNKRHYITAGGLGLPSKIVQFANTAKQHRETCRGIYQMLGSKLYFFAALYMLLKEGPQHDRLRIRWNGGSLDAQALSLMVSNQSFAGKYFIMSPAACNDDGLFDVCLIENSNRRTSIFSTFLKVLAGRHVNSQGVKLWRAAELIVDAEEPVSFFGDGELISRATHFKIKILPGALNDIVPEHVVSHLQHPKFPARDKETAPLCSPN